MHSQTSSTIVQKNSSLNNKPRIKPLYFLIGFIIISTVFAFILGGYYLGKNGEEEKRNASTNIEEQVDLDIEKLPGNPDNWTTYSFDELNLEIKIPDELNKNIRWYVSNINSDSGNIICFSDQELSDENECIGDELLIGTTSNNFTSERELNFMDSQGFEINNATYIVNGMGNENYDISTARYKLFENNSDFAIIKILGEDNLPGTPEKGYLGAIAITNNPNYPAVVFQMKIDGEVSEYEFDQILESLTPAN